MLRQGSTGKAYFCSPCYQLGFLKGGWRNHSQIAQSMAGKLMTVSSKSSARAVGQRHQFLHVGLAMGSLGFLEAWCLSSRSEHANRTRKKLDSLFLTQPLKSQRHCHHNLSVETDSKGGELYSPLCGGETSF